MGPILGQTVQFSFLRPCHLIPIYYVDAIIGFRDATTVVRANESDGEVILVVTSDGGNEEAVSVEYAYTSGTAQGNDRTLYFARNLHKIF